MGSGGSSRLVPNVLNLIMGHNHKTSVMEPLIAQCYAKIAG